MCVCRAGPSCHPNSHTLTLASQPEWAPLCERPRTAHVARRDYILQRILLVREQGGDDRWQLRQPEDEEEAAE